jgi:hypothetical protein
MGQLEIEGQRGFEVGKGLDQQRDAVIALGRKRFEFQFRDHGRSSGSHAHGASARIDYRADDAFEERMRRFIPIGPKYATHGAAVHAGLVPGASAVQMCRLTPGPGSPVSTTCIERAMNEHDADSVAHSAAAQTMTLRCHAMSPAGDSPYCGEIWQTQIYRTGRPPAKQARNNQHEETAMPSAV